MVAGMIDSDERIVTVENASEIRLPSHLKRVISLESRPPNLEGMGEVSVRDLVLNAARMRADRIIVGEVRGEVAFDLFSLMNTGHDGCMFTLHSRGIRDTLTRLETMVTMADVSMPLLQIRQEMASAIDLVLHQERLRDGTRKVMKVSEVVGLQGDAMDVRDIFEFRQTGVKDEKVTGYFSGTGYIPSFLQKLRDYGIELPLSMFTPV
jgi:pilus assembly protein CpaF